MFELPKINTSTNLNYISIGIALFVNAVYPCITSIPFAC